MRKKMLLFGLLFSSAVSYMACDKGGDDPAPANPCTGVTVVVTATTTNATQGQSNGTINAAATGGTGFTFSINNGAFQNTGAFTGVAAGTHTVTAKNSNGCTGSAQFTVGSTNACAGVTITANNSVTNAVPCPNASSGGISVAASGGTAPYTYSMGNGTFQAGNTFSGLPAGNYTIVVRDANGCTSTSTTAAISNAPAGSLFSAVRSIVQTNCVGCHSASSPAGGVSLATDCNIVARAARIKARAVDAAGTPQRMPPPPSAPLSASDQQAITNWVAAGGGYTN